MSEPKKGARVTKKDVIDNPKNTDYIVTFDDGSVKSTRESKVYFTAASYPTFRHFLINCKVGDVWEGENDEKHTGESSDNTSNNTDK